MNCFKHADRPALGLCKSCGKGLCSECLVEVPDGLACKCKNQCEDRVNLINQIINNNQKVLSAANVQVKSSGIFILLLGILFCLFGFLPILISGNTSTIFMGLLGLFFAVYGIIRLIKKSQQYPQAK